ncbi:MAG: hypothetical protein K8U03_11880 [Planctomycetia bacterium]|nr:hypothetical protein [Planctomycetia bacterium]
MAPIESLPTPLNESNCMKEYEKEVVLPMVPSEFAANPDVIVLSATRAKEILSRLKFELPQTIANNTRLQNYLQDDFGQVTTAFSYLTDEQIDFFNREASSSEDDRS